MCKTINDGGQRCACDTSKARRLRRHNATAIAHYAKAPTTTSLTQETPLVEVTLVASPTTAVSPAAVSIEAVKHVQEDISVLKEFNYGQPNQEVSLSDGSLLKTTETEMFLTDASGNLLVYGDRSEDTLMSVCEHQTRVAGRMINELATQRSGVDFESLNQTEKINVKRLDREFQDAQKEVDKIQEEINQAYEPKSLYDPIKKRLTSHSSHGVMNIAAREGDEAALELQQRFKEADEELKRAHAVGFDANMNGTAEAQEQIQKQGEAIKVVLQEVREFGGEVTVDADTKPAAIKIINESVGQVFPTQWLEEANTLTPVEVKMTAGRAHYSPFFVVRKSQATITDKKVVIKPEGWSPDPNSPHDLGNWVQVNANDVQDGQVVDPETTLRSHIVPEAPTGQQVWLHSPVDRVSTTSGVRKPRGAVEQTVKKQAWDAAQGKMVETGEEEKVWISPQKVQVQDIVDCKPLLTISTDKTDTYRAAIHEFSHRVETTPTIGRYITGIESAFIRRRTTNEQGERDQLEGLYGGKSELARKDHFADGYIGKEYNASKGANKPHEVLAVGVESVFAGSLGGLVGAGNRKPDHEMRDLIVGLFATG